MAVLLAIHDDHGGEAVDVLLLVLLVFVVIGIAGRLR